MTEKPVNIINSYVVVKCKGKCNMKMRERCEADELLLLSLLRVVVDNPSSHMYDSGAFE